MFQPKAAIKLHRLEAPVRWPARSKRQSQGQCALVLLSDVGKNLRVVPARVFFLSFPKGYVVGDTADSSVSFRILLSHLDRDTDWHRRDAARPIKFDMPCANILLGFLHGVSRISKSARPQRNTRQRGPVRERASFSSNVIMRSATVSESEVFQRRCQSTVITTFPRACPCSR